MLTLECFPLTAGFGLRLPWTSADRGFNEENDAFDEEVVGLDETVGGCGKAAILIVFLTVFSGMPLGLPVVDADLRVGTAGDEVADNGVGRAEGRGEAVGILSFIGVCVVGVLGTGRLFRDFDDGMAGNGAVGASTDGIAGIMVAIECPSKAG